MKYPSKWLFRQFRFAIIGKYLDLTQRSMRVLDVGCGRSSPALTMQEIADCEYHSIDLMSAEEALSVNGVKGSQYYRQIDLEKDCLRPLADLQFNVIVLCHVIEHLDNGLEVVEEAARRLAPGGVLFVEYPRLQSVNFPSMEGTLNFWDDPTHKSFYSLTDIANTMARAHLIVREAKVRRFWRRILLFPFGVAHSLVTKGKPRAGNFWDVLGFSEYAVGVRGSRGTSGP